MEKFSTKISKLFIDSGEDGIVGDVFLAKQNEKIIDKLGNVFGLAELHDLPDEFTEELLEIISDLNTEYYLPPLEAEYGVEKRFEECLQRANRRIGKIIRQSVAKVEPENINVLVGLLHRNKLYLSQINRVNAFLFHFKSKNDCVIIDILNHAPIKKQKTDEDKMFSNIVSGEISTKDRLIFCNETVREHLSQKKLSDILTEESRLSATDRLEQALVEYSELFSAIIVEPEEEVTEPAPANLATQRIATGRVKIKDEFQTQNSLNRLINTQEKTKQYLAPSLAPNWQKIAWWLLNLARQLLKIIHKYTLIGGRVAGQQLHRGFILLRKKIKKLFNKNNSSQELAEEEPIAKSKVEKIRKDYQVSGANGNYPERVSHWLNDQIAKFVGLKRIQQLILIFAFLLIFAFSQSIVWQGQSRTVRSATTAESTMRQITETITTAEAQNIFNDEDGAKNSLAEARRLLAELPDKRSYREERNKLLARVDDLDKLLQKVTYLDAPEVLADLTNLNTDVQAAGLTKIGDSLFTYDNNKKNVYKIDLANKQSSALTADSINSSVKKVGAVNDKKIILQADDNFYQYDLTKNSASIAFTPKNPVTDFDLYGGKIYTLQNNQIYKHLPANDAFNAGTPWLKSGLDISGATAITLDGGIFVSRDNGQINYFLNSASTDFAINEINPALTSPRQIFSQPEGSYLYALDSNNQRIVVFDKKGVLKTQYTSKEFNDLRAMAVMEKEKKIYLLNGTKILAIDIGF